MARIRSETKVLSTPKPSMFTERLRLIPVTPSMRNAMRDSRAAFAALVGVSLSERWPQFPEAFSLGTRSTPDPWTGYLFILRSAPILVGNGGFVSEPDEAGTVEIGYDRGDEAPAVLTISKGRP